MSGQCRDNVGADKNRLDKSRLEESREEDIKDLRISNEIREDFSSSTCPDDGRDILLEATDPHIDSHSHSHSHSHTHIHIHSHSHSHSHLDTVSSPKRKIAGNDNDKKRKSSDSAEKGADAESQNLYDSEKITSLSVPRARVLTAELPSVVLLNLKAHGRTTASAALTGL